MFRSYDFKTLSKLDLLQFNINQIKHKISHKYQFLLIAKTQTMKKDSNAKTNKKRFYNVAAIILAHFHKLENIVVF